MTFWDTVMGHHLADTLIRCLPKLTEKKQVIKRFELKSEAIEFIENEIKRGNCFGNMLEDNGVFYAIIETR